MTFNAGKKLNNWMRRRVSLILTAAILLLCLLTPGCDQAPTSSQSLDSAGIEIVESAEPVWGEGEGWRIGSQASLRIGVVDGDPAYQFNRIAGAVRLEDGRVVVGDEGTHDIRYFGADGQHLLTVGRSGEGPGEFLTLSGLGRAPSGGVWAYDFSLRRVTWLDDGGAIDNLTSLDMEPPTLNSVGALPGGQFILKQLWGATQVSEAVATGLRRDPVAVVRFNSGGALLDSVGSIPGREVYLTDENGRGVMNTPPCDRNATATLRGDRIVVGSQETFQLEELGSDGRLLRIIRIPGKLTRVESDDVEDYIQTRLEGAPLEDHPSIRRSLESMPTPETFPAYGELLADASGNLWVGDWVQYSQVPSEWTIMDEAGRWLGAVEVPEGFHPMDIGEDWILGLERDEMDVEYVTLYPLMK